MAFLTRCSEQIDPTLIIQAMSGLMSITGPVDGAPCKVGVAISDVTAGLFATQDFFSKLPRRHDVASRPLPIDLMDDRYF